MSADPEDFETLMAHYDLAMAERDEKLRRDERERILTAIEAELRAAPMYSQKSRVAAVIAKLREGSK